MSFTAPPARMTPPPATVCSPVAVGSPAREAQLSREEKEAVRVRVAHPAQILLASFFLVASGLTVAIIEWTVPQLDPQTEKSNIVTAALHHALSEYRPAHNEIVCVATNGNEDPPPGVIATLGKGGLPLATQSECQYGKHTSGLKTRFLSLTRVVWLPKNRVHVGAHYQGQRTLVLDYKQGRWQVVGSLG